jgi:hypothetical protein
MTTLANAIKTAEKTGTLLAYITGEEKWNHPSDQNDYGKIPGIRGDGTLSETFDVEGHRWTDIYFPTTVPSLSLIFFSALFTSLFEITKSSIEVLRCAFGSEDLTMAQKITKSISAIFEIYGTLDLSHFRWVVCFSTLDIFRQDLIEEEAYDLWKKPGGGIPNLSIGDFSNLISNEDKRKEYTKSFDELRLIEDKMAALMTKEKLTKILVERAIEIAPGIYTKKDDPTSIIVDEDVIPHALKDGYSNVEILQILQIWGDKTLGLSGVPVKEAKEPVHSIFGGHDHINFKYFSPFKKTKSKA